MEKQYSSNLLIFCLPLQSVVQYLHLFPDRYFSLLLLLQSFLGLQLPLICWVQWLWCPLSSRSLIAAHYEVPFHLFFLLVFLLLLLQLLIEVLGYRWPSTFFLLAHPLSFWIFSWSRGWWGGGRGSALLLLFAFLLSFSLPQLILFALLMRISVLITQDK